MNCPDVRLLILPPGKCDEGKRFVQIRVEFFEIQQDTSFSGFIVTTDGDNKIPVYFPGDAYLEWKIGSEPGSKRADLFYPYPPGTYENILLNIVTPTGCTDILPEALDGSKLSQLIVDDCPPPDSSPPCLSSISDYVLEVSDTCKAGKWELTFEAIIESAQVGDEFVGFFVGFNVDTAQEFDIPGQDWEPAGDGKRLVKGSIELSPGSYEIKAKNECSEYYNTVSPPTCEDECPVAVTLNVFNNLHQPVDPDGADCLPAGLYTVQAVVEEDPLDLDVTYVWRVNDLQVGENEPTYTHNLNLGETPYISVTVQTPNCPEISKLIFLKGCPDPEIPPDGPEIPPDDSETPWWWPDWVPTVPDWLCLIWMIVNIILLITTAVAIASAACGWVIPEFGAFSTGAAFVLAVITLISVILWLFACGWKANVCPWARWAPRVIAAIGFIAGILVLVIAIIELVIASSVTGGPGGSISIPCFFGIAIEFAYYGFLAYIATEILTLIGCTPLDFWTLNPTNNDT